MDNAVRLLTYYWICGAVLLLILFCFSKIWYLVVFVVGVGIGSGFGCCVFSTEEEEEGGGRDKVSVWEWDGGNGIRECCVCSYWACATFDDVGCWIAY